MLIWLGAARDAASGIVVIHSSDTHLSTINADTGVYHDNVRPGTFGAPRVQIPRSNGGGWTSNVCGGRLRAFAYSYEGVKVIVLCPNLNSGALRVLKGISLDNTRTVGAFLAENLSAIGINIFQRFLSYMILLEYPLVEDMNLILSAVQGPQRLPVWNHTNICDRHQIQCTVSQILPCSLSIGQCFVALLE